VDGFAAGLAAVGFATAALSGVAGIGGGTVLIGALYALGLSPPVAVPLHGAIQAASNGSRIVAYRKTVEWRAAGWFMLGAAPAPFLLAPLAAQANLHVVELLLAALILVSLVPEPKDKAHLSMPAAMVFAGALATGLGMFTGAVGLFVGRLFLRPEWNKETLIGTLALCQTTGHLLKIAGYGVAGFSVLARPDLLVPLLLSVVAGTAAGKWLNQHLDEAKFRTLFRGLLLALSLKLAWDGVSGLLL
jgi:uncharacterized membrane protein YfcA